jgi:hypothetical protein
MEDINRLIEAKQLELAKYRESAKDFPMELRRRFSVHYINMLESQLRDLQSKKNKDSSN